MAAPIKPALKQALGTEAWGFVPLVADVLVPKLTELNATGGINLSCSIFGEQEGVTSTTEKVSLPRLLCERTTYQTNGETNYEMADLMISFQPQAAALSDGKKAWETLVDGMEGFLWRRQGVESALDLAIAQFVDVMPVTLGVKTPSKTGNDSAGVYAFMLPVSVTGKPAYNVAIAT